VCVRPVGPCCNKMLFFLIQRYVALLCIPEKNLPARVRVNQLTSSYNLFGWLVADGWCWFVLREKYCWLIVADWFVLREKYCWLVADKPSEQGDFLYRVRVCWVRREHGTGTDTSSAERSVMRGFRFQTVTAQLTSNCSRRSPRARPVRETDRHARDRQTTRGREEGGSAGGRARAVR
jgi:hypothetical protein